jgi:hypothetical protein
MNFGSGNIGYTIPAATGPGASGARNGDSTNGGFVVLGQNVGEAGNPAALLSTREIPYSALEIVLKNLATANTDFRMGLVSAGRIGLKINGLAGAIATFWMTNAGAGTYKDWQWEAVTSGNGELILNDQVGNFFRMSRDFSSISTPFYFAMPLLDVAATPYNVAANVDRSRRLFTNRGAAGVIVFNLPGLVSALFLPDYTFTTVNAFAITLTAPAGMTIRVGAVVSAVAGTITSAGGPGTSIRLKMLNGTDWQAIAVVGAWVTP